MPTYPQLNVKPGDEITLDLVNGVSGITGEVAEAVTDKEGGVLQLAIQDDPSRPDPLWIRGDLISIWRLGKAVIRRQIPAGLQVPIGVPNGLQQRLGG